MGNIKIIHISEDCQYCFGTGEYARPNGPDDFDIEFCDCPAGQKLMADVEMEEAIERIKASSVAV